MPVNPALATVTGAGCVCSAGNTLDAVLDSLESSPPVPAPPSRFPEVTGVHPVFQATLPPGRARLGDPGLDMLLESALQAVAQAGLTPADLAGRRVGVSIGSSVGFAVNYFPLYRQWKGGDPAPDGLLDTFRASNYALALGRALELDGPCQLVATACASGTDAIGTGAGWIASGLCDMVLAGGAESLSFISYQGFIRLMITDPAPCRPFDRNRCGLNLGEGAAVLLLEREGTPRAAQGRVLGYGSASDAYHPTAPHPEGRGLRTAFSAAMKQAGVTPSDVAFVSVHGTGTMDNDKVESLVLRDLLPGVPALATKGATGHALGAAGAIEAALSIGCLNRGRVPASPGFRTPDPELGVSPVSEPLALTRRVALSDSLAFGGCNSALVLEGRRS